MRVLTFILLILGLSACGTGSLTLSPADDQANNQFVNAIEFNNQFKRWINGLPDQSGPTSEEWLTSLRLLERAIDNAKLVPSDFLVRAHRDLPNMWQDFFIPSMEKTHSYHSNAVTDPTSVKAPSSPEGAKQLEVLFEADNLDSTFGNWYSKNQDAIGAGLRRMAK